MKVYILVDTDDDRRSHVRGAYSTQEKAREAVAVVAGEPVVWDDYWARTAWCDFHIEAHEVDEVDAP